MKIIAGLGNPEKKYELTRHNAGFMAVDVLAKELGESWKKEKKFNTEIIKTGDIILAKPLTYMNLSGEAVQKILSYYKLNVKDLIVIHDDIDIALGKYKISADSRSAGHNGVQSIIDALGTKNFKRIRVGIKTEKKEKIPVDKFVLQKFKKEELEIINQITKKIINEIK